MNFSYTYRPFYLLAFGIEFILICIPAFFFLMIGIYNNFISNLATKDQVFLITVLFGILLITAYGGYNIIQGTHRFEIQFSETNFKSYKDSKLEINVPIERIERINIVKGDVFFLIYGGFKYFVLKIEIEGIEHVKLTIRGKKWISKFFDFLELLKKFCNDNQVQLFCSKF